MDVASGHPAGAGPWAKQHRPSAEVPPAVCDPHQEAEQGNRHRFGTSPMCMTFSMHEVGQFSEPSVRW